jgi:hypothetical protein
VAVSQAKLEDSVMTLQELAYWIGVGSVGMLVTVVVLMLIALWRR